MIIFDQSCFPKTSILGSKMNYGSSDWKFTSAISQNIQSYCSRTLINCYHVQNHVMTKFKDHFFCRQFFTIARVFLAHKPNWFSFSLWINFLPQRKSILSHFVLHSQSQFPSCWHTYSNISLYNSTPLSACTISINSTHNQVFMNWFCLPTDKQN